MENEWKKDSKKLKKMNKKPPPVEEKWTVKRVQKTRVWVTQERRRERKKNILREKEDEVLDGSYKRRTMKKYRKFKKKVYLTLGLLRWIAIQ